MLVSMCSSWSSHPLLVGIQMVEPTLEITFQFIIKLIIYLPCDPAGKVFRGINTYVHPQICTQMAALFIIIKRMETTQRSVNV